MYDNLASEGDLVFPQLIAFAFNGIGHVLSAFAKVESI
jgi:hypothetical protein